jgi:SAM-dependent methyltransferase
MFVMSAVESNDRGRRKTKVETETRSQRRTSSHGLVRAAAWWSEGIRLCTEEGATSGRMMGYACRNKASGKGLVGRWIDRRFLNYPGWEGVRQRRALLEELILCAIDNLGIKTPGTTVCILDIAGGTADYLIGALAKVAVGTVSALSLDISERTVNAGRLNANQAGLANIRFEIADAGDSAAIRRFMPRPDLVICSGFYELLNDDAAVATSIEMIAGLLSDNGRFILSHQNAVPTLGWAGKLLGCFNGEHQRMKMRPASEIAALLASRGFVVDQCRSAADLYTIFLARRIRQD